MLDASVEVAIKFLRVIMTVVVVVLLSGGQGDLNFLSGWAIAVCLSTMGMATGKLCWEILCSSSSDSCVDLILGCPVHTKASRPCQRWVNNGEVGGCTYSSDPWRWHALTAVKLELPVAVGDAVTAGAVAAARTISTSSDFGPTQYL